MPFDPCKATAFRIPAQPKLDPIMVVFVDHESGRGQLIVACFGMSWSAYWNAMGERTTQEFVSQADADYITNALIRNERKSLKREENYLRRIVDAVKVALREAA